MRIRTWLLITALVMTAGIVTASEDPDVDDVELTVGHCWISPVEFVGQTWVVRKSEQFGWGGHIPESWVGVGSMTRISEGHSVYEDQGGLELTLVLKDSPAAAWLKKALCA